MADEIQAETDALRTVSKQVGDMSDQIASFLTDFKAKSDAYANSTVFGPDSYGQQMLKGKNGYVPSTDGVTALIGSYTSTLGGDQGFSPSLAAAATQLEATERESADGFDAIAE